MARGETKRLMVLMPPGSAKSTYASDLFPAWYLAQAPNRRIIAASNTADLAGSFSRRVRGRIREHSGLLGIRLAREAEELWATSNGGEYRAAGVGGVITGLRADLGIIDDPVKSRQDADSALVQSRVWDWYWGDFYTRLKPGASQVLIMTRWAEGDLGGRLEEAEGDQWRIIRLPAVAEDGGDLLGRAPGEWLWADDGYGFGAKLKDDFRSLTNAGRTRDWSALYQQRPTPETGDYFQRQWLRPAETMPARSTLRVYGASDYAVTQDGGDFTVHVVVGVDPDRRLWLLDLWRGQASSDVWVDAFCDLVRQWKPIGWAEETGQIRAGVGPFLDQRMRQRQAHVARTQFPTRGDKSVRAQSIRGRMALDGLYIPRVAPWRADFEAEMMAFPAGKHDDIVDALGLVGQLLDRMAPGVTPPKDKPPRDTWAEAFAKAGGGEEVDGWRVA